ncbi:MAG: DNA polymerase III subunit delta [Phycisphaerae bacterium]|nr:DNA polymerase III subunit delta [Phycisphaerae bacterium]
MATHAGKRTANEASRGGAGGPMPVYVVFGPEQFLKDRAIHGILDALLAPGDRGTCLGEYEGASASLADVLDDLRTLPFLGPRRVVWLRDADPFITEHRAALESYLAEPSPTGALILDCRSFPSNTRLYKSVKAIGECIPCEAPKKYTLPAWLVDRCRTEYAKNIDLEAARLIVEQIGDDLGQLDGELAKLSLYVGQRRAITMKDVTALVGQQREQKVFGLLGAMADGDRAEALRLWEEVWQTDRAAQARAIGGIAWGVRQMIAAHSALRDGVPVGALAKRYFTDPQRLQTRLRVFTPQRLYRQLDQLCEADVASKTGMSSVQTSIEEFILDHTAARGR